MATHILPYWFGVLNHFDNREYIRNGLTVPFLIGSGGVISPASELLTIGEFMTEAVYSPLPRPITMMRCWNIGEIVIGVRDRETPDYLYPKIGNCMLIDDPFNGIEDFSAIVLALEERYENYISGGKFSKESGKWGDYSDEDKERLREVQTLES
jgi:hypothetical protein